MKKCPFCAEKIQDQAVKCRFCGSELKIKSQVGFKFSDSARDVAQGIKKKELDDTVYHVWVFIAIVIGAFVGYATESTGTGLITFFVIGILAAMRYFKK